MSRVNGQWREREMDTERKKDKERKIVKEKKARQMERERERDPFLLTKIDGFTLVI